MTAVVQPYFQNQNLRYILIPFRDIDDQRILQCNYMRGLTGHTQSKVVVQMLPFFDDYLHVKNLKDILIPSRDTDENVAIWLAEIILGHTWRTRLFPDTGFSKIIRNTFMHHFLCKKDIVSSKNSPPTKFESKIVFPTLCFPPLNFQNLIPPFL